MGDSITHTPVIMISGTGRSGTNVTKKIFSEHPDVATLPFEYRFIIDPGGIIDFYNSFAQIWSPYWPDAKIKALRDFLLSLASLPTEKRAETERVKSIDAKGLSLSPPAYSGWELNEWIPGFSGFVETLIEDLTAFQYPAIWPGTAGGVENNTMIFQRKLDKAALTPPIRAFLENCYRSILKVQNKSVFLEDNTHNILFADDLFALSPKAKLIHMVRDPRDVIASLKTQRWAPSDIHEIIVWYDEVMKRWYEVRERLDTERYLEVHFEDLVNDTSATLNKLGDFTGLEITDDMRSVDLSHNNIGRHAIDLAPQEVDAITRNLSDYMEHYQYSKS